MLPKKVQDAIEDVLRRRESVGSMQEQLKEDVKAIAETMGIKAAQLNKILGLIEKERTTGGAVEAERQILDLAVEAVGEE